MSGSFQDGYVNGNADYCTAPSVGNKRKRLADDMETVGDSFVSRSTFFSNSKNVSISDLLK